MPPPAAATWLPSEVRSIGHELTAFYGLDHAETLAVVLPGVWQLRFDAKKAKLEQYGRRVWNVSTGQEAVSKTEAFFHSLGMPTRLSDYGINAAEAAQRVEARFKARGVAFGEAGDIDGAAAAAVLRSRA